MSPTVVLTHVNTIRPPHWLYHLTICCFFLFVFLFNLFLISTSVETCISHPLTKPIQGNYPVVYCCELWLLSQRGSCLYGLISEPDPQPTCALFKALHLEGHVEVARRKGWQSRDQSWGYEMQCCKWIPIIPWLHNALLVFLCVLTVVSEHSNTQTHTHTHNSGLLWCIIKFLLCIKKPS